MEYFLFSLPSVPDKLRCMDNVSRCEVMRGEEVRRVWRTSQPSQPSSPARHHPTTSSPPSVRILLSLSRNSWSPRPVPSVSINLRDQHIFSSYVMAGMVTTRVVGWPWSVQTNILPPLLPVIIRHYATPSASSSSLSLSKQLSAELGEVR